MRLSLLVSTLVTLCLAAVPASAEEDGARDYTCFQTASPWMPEIDVGSDVAIVYGVNESFADRVAQWRAEGYTASMMTGISWGGYGDYYMTEDGFRKEEVQTDKKGELFMHGNSKTVGYNVPTDAYVEYIKTKVTPAVEAGVRAVYMEEPEYWAKTGWSEGFKQAWKDFYGEDWVPPDSSVDAQWRASLLKYELYFNALREVFAHIKEKAREKGISVECHVPTHSLVNYAQWRIVSPESHLMDLEEMDGYIAQVWTGTARSANVYRGEHRSRTFETAFLEYGQMLGMVRPTGRKVWFLADPIEDNPNRSWADYKVNYECTIIASLMWPEVHRFEVMPWPRRIFKGAYPKVDMDSKSDREGIPAEYATEILTIINALNDMKQEEVQYDTGTRGVGVIVSDTLMFQRANPHPSEAHLSSFFGLAMPLVKHGIPVEPVQLENVIYPNTLAPYDVVFLTYEGQKPLKPAYHQALVDWVRQGGSLIVVGDGTDPYHHVRAWWNNNGEEQATAYDDLFTRLDIHNTARHEPVKKDHGWVRVSEDKPRQLARYPFAAEKVLELLDKMLAARGKELHVQHYFDIRRGPYVVAAAMNESVSKEPLRLEGRFVDLFDPALGVVTGKVLAPDERALLYDLAWCEKKSIEAKVIAAAMRVRGERVEGNTLRFTGRGPKATTARARILLPNAPESITCTPEREIRHTWDAESGTLWLETQNTAEDVAFEIAY